MDGRTPASQVGLCGVTTIGIGRKAKGTSDKAMDEDEERKADSWNLEGHRAGVAQRQSNCFVNSRSPVRSRPPAPRIGDASPGRSTTGVSGRPNRIWTSRTEGMDMAKPYPGRRLHHAALT